MKMVRSLAEMLMQSVFEDIQTALFYNIMRQRIPNYANADLKNVVANTTTIEKLLRLSASVCRRYGS